MAESELGALSSQCLARRIADKAALLTQVEARVADRNKRNAKADWRFTTNDALRSKPIAPGAGDRRERGQRGERERDEQQQ